LQLLVLESLPKFCSDQGEVLFGMAFVARPKWAGAMCKSQNTPEVVLSVWNSGFGI
jgi:hypothetical protein